MFDTQNLHACNVFLPQFDYSAADSDQSELAPLRGRAHILLHLHADSADFDLGQSKAKEAHTLCQSQGIAVRTVITGRDTSLGYLTHAVHVTPAETFFVELPASLSHASSLNYACVVDASGKICWISFDLSLPHINVLVDKLKEMRVSATELMDLRAPVLLVDNVFTPDQCEHIIAHFNSRTSTQGKVGDRVNTASKIRDDVFLTADESREIDEITLQSLLPEMQRVFGFVGTHRETYKIGCYKGGDGGFYRPHRDKYRGPKLKEQSYRQYSYTINLNDDFEGGGIYFPEYSPDFYKVPKGGAIVFPSHLLHGVYPVTSGERYVLVCFAFDQNAQRMRHAHVRDFDPVNAEQRLKRSYAIDPDIFSAYDVYQRSLERTSPSLTIPSALIQRFEDGSA